MLAAVFCAGDATGGMPCATKLCKDKKKGLSYCVLSYINLHNPAAGIFREAAKGGEVHYQSVAMLLTSWSRTDPSPVCCC